MASKLSDMQWHEVEEYGRAGMRGKAIVDAMDLDIHPANINKYLQKKGIGATGEVAELTIAEARREQMESLFYNYKDTPPIEISKLKEGTRVVIISDMQVPFEEPWLFSTQKGRKGAINAFIRDFNPGILAVNGDGFDAYSVSSYDKKPSRRFTLNDEKSRMEVGLDHLEDDAPDAERIYIEGNHEDRLQRALVSLCQKDIRAVEFFGATQLSGLGFRSLLQLDKRGWLSQPYGGYADILGFKITHGDVVGQESGETARKMFQKWHSSGTSGHTHRLGAYYHRDAAGKTHAWYESGCLCRFDLEYVTNPNWQQGFLIGEVSNNKLHMHLVPVFDNRFYVPGVGIYKGKV